MSRRKLARILYVEGSDICRTMLKRMLGLIDVRAELICAGTIADARTLLSAMPIDMILLDNALPDGRGADFAMEIAGDARLGRIPLALVSDWPSPFMYAKAKVAGALGVIPKDEFNLSVLRGLIGQAGLMPPRPVKGRDGESYGRTVTRRRTAAA